MILFHIHQPLDKASLSRLVSLLTFTKKVSRIVFREQGIENLNQTRTVSSLNEYSTLSLLNSDVNSESLKQFHNSFVAIIDDKQFVKLCCEAEKIIAWK